jgi:nucleoside diphosphate kinase
VPSQAANRIIEARTLSGVIVDYIIGDNFDPEYARGEQCIHTVRFMTGTTKPRTGSPGKQHSFGEKSKNTGYRSLQS